MRKILVVEDEDAIREVVALNLRLAGYEVTEAASAEQALAVFSPSAGFDVAVLDIMLPGMNGFSLCETIRRDSASIGIIMLSAKTLETDKIKGLSIGADDYMTKPIDLDELLLHIGALLRRAKIVNSRKLEVGKLLLDADERTAYLDGEEISLTVREFNLIYKLLSYPKKTFTRSQLMDEFWEGDTTSGLRTVDVYMTKLRNKFFKCGDFEIVTVHGLGYKAVLK